MSIWPVRHVHFNCPAGFLAARNRDRWTTLISAGIILALAVVIFTAYTLHHLRHRDQVGKQAASFATLFIQSSPVVEKQLGEVHALREVKEIYRTGALRDGTSIMTLPVRTRPGQSKCG
jgi:hypothetical protein